MFPPSPGTIALIAAATIAGGLFMGAAFAIARLRAAIAERQIPPVTPQAFEQAAALIRGAERIEMIARRVDEVDIRLHVVERNVLRRSGEEVPIVGAPVSRHKREAGGWEESTDARATTAPRKKIDP